ncbi:hypothetical protein GCM10011405_40330 [Rufibacter glacialis]|nr:hypothetical protein GCM10011405_40330 [Rufibacter glacialis]
MNSTTSNANFNTPKAGWSHSGLFSPDNTVNLGVQDANNSSSSRSATFDGLGDQLMINFSGITNQVPGELTYYIAYTGASINGEVMRVEESVNGADWTTLKSIEGSSSSVLKNANDATQGNATLSSATLSPNSRYLRFRAMVTPPAGTYLLVDRVSLSAGNAPEIQIATGATVQANHSTYTFEASQNVNTTSTPVTFTIENKGAQPLSITSLSLGGADAKEYEVISAPATSVPVGGTTTFQVVFKPISIGTKTASISIANNDADENPYLINLSAKAAYLAPIVSSFDPEADIVGNTITIHGSNFTNVEAIIFNNGTTTGRTATYTRLDDNKISVTVPSGAITGKVQFAYNKGTIAESNNVFTVIPTPVIASFSPANGPVGTLVTVTGKNFTEDGGILFKDANGDDKYAVGYVYVSSTEVQGRVPQGAVTGVISIEDENGYKTSSAEEFTVPIPAPVITSLDPDRAQVGAAIIVNGSNLKGVTTITFGGVLAPEYNDNDGNALVVYVPEGAKSGDLVVTTPGGSARSTFTVIAPVPNITDFTPKRGPAGTLVTVRGLNFTRNGGLLFKNATGDYISSEDYEFVNSTEIRGKVPAKAVTGLIAVKDDNNAIAESDENFIRTYVAPDIIAVSPNSGPAGTVVSISGTDLTNIISVSFNGAPATFNETETGLTATVPNEAPSGQGFLTVKTLGGSDDIAFMVLEPSTLPVELIDFTGKSSTVGTVLRWKTASEKENAYFEVQASTSPLKGEFKTIQRVNSKVTNSASLTSYEVVDRTVAKGKVTYYRLKQVDLNGESEVSKIIAVENIASTQTSASVKVYPNPFSENESLKVELVAEKAGPVKATLYYVTGKKAFEQVYQVERGVSTIELPLNSSPLATGMYILTTEINGETMSTRVIKK